MELHVCVYSEVMELLGSFYEPRLFSARVVVVGVFVELRQKPQP